MTARTRRPGQKKDRARGVAARNPSVLTRARKAGGALVCAECGVVQHRGRWSWGKPPLVELTEGRCPACERVRQHYPAGILSVPADRFTDAKDRKDVLALIRNVEKAERPEHPLERLMAIEDSNGRLVVSTTGVHLARQLAHSLAKHFHAKPSIRYADGEGLVHVNWVPRTTP